MPCGRPRFFRENSREQDSSTVSMEPFDFKDLMVGPSHLPFILSSDSDVGFALGSLFLVPDDLASRLIS